MFSQSYEQDVPHTIIMVITKYTPKNRKNGFFCITTLLSGSGVPEPHNLCLFLPIINRSILSWRRTFLPQLVRKNSRPLFLISCLQASKCTPHLIPSHPRSVSELSSRQLIAINAEYNVYHFSHIIHRSVVKLS